MRGLHREVVAVVTGLLILGLAACGTDDERQQGGCTPGSIAACYCLNGVAGSQTCEAQGHSYSECDCRPVADGTSSDALGDADAPDAAAPDVVAPEPSGLDAASEPSEAGASDLASEPREVLADASEVAEFVGPDACAPACAGKECGPDGCGNSCGACPGDGVCVGGQCLCLPACQGKVCGADGCGGSCGSCEAGFLCSGAQLCETDCTPVPVSPCDVLFSAPVTSPLVQDHVWVTGSFTNWAASQADGAVPLTLDAVAGEWRGVVSVPSGPFEFKYLVKWPDGGEQWCVISEAGFFECLVDAPNQSGTSTCGVINPCS